MDDVQNFAEKFTKLTVAQADIEVYKLHAHRFTHPIFLDEGKHVYHISWSSFVYLLEGVIRKEKDEYFDEYEEYETDGEELQESV